MPGLIISLLGPFAVWLDGKVITSFKSNKVRALLAYLVAEAGRPQVRGSLAGLLWPNFPEGLARKSLNQALYSLRKTLKNTTCIRSDRQTITLIPDENFQIDIIQLENALKSYPSEISGLEAAVGSYRGIFLDSFTLNDSPEFETWILIRREKHNRQMLEALNRLVDWHEQQGEYDNVEIYLRRQLEIEPWLEEAHRQLMRLLALKGQRPEALAQYKACRKNLKNELDVEPSAETMQLYESIRDGEISGGDSSQTQASKLARAGHQLYRARERDRADQSPAEEKPSVDTHWSRRGG